MTGVEDKTAVDKGAGHSLQGGMQQPAAHAGSAQLRDHPGSEQPQDNQDEKQFIFRTKPPRKTSYQQEAMQMSVVCADRVGFETHAGARSYVDVHDPCYHQRPWGCQWSVLSPAVTSKEASFAVVLITED